jgi:hypothetical protein
MKELLERSFRYENLPNTCCFHMVHSFGTSNLIHFDSACMNHVSSAFSPSTLFATPTLSSIIFVSSAVCFLACPPFIQLISGFDPPFSHVTSIIQCVGTSNSVELMALLFSRLPLCQSSLPSSFVCSIVKLHTRFVLPSTLR